MGVLDEDSADRHLMVFREIDRELHVVERELAARVVDGVPLDRRVHRRGAVLEHDDVLRAARDHGGAGHAQHAQRDLVRHRARRHEDRSLLAEPRGELGLELVDRRVFAAAVVADHRLGHRAPHGR